MVSSHDERLQPRPTLQTVTYIHYSLFKLLTNGTYEHIDGICDNDL